MDARENGLARRALAIALARLPRMPPRRQREAEDARNPLACVVLPIAYSQL